MEEEKVGIKSYGTCAWHNKSGVFICCERTSNKKFDANQFNCCQVMR
jgi:hypothetical protein